MTTDDVALYLGIAPTKVRDLKRYNVPYHKAGSAIARGINGPLHWDDGVIQRIRRLMDNDLPFRIACSVAPIASDAEGGVFIPTPKAKQARDWLRVA